MEIKFKRLNPNAKSPQRMTSGAAGFDLVATSHVYGDDCVHTYGTGLAFEIPEGHVGLLFPRSSVYKTDLVLSNCVGVIDSDYRGEVSAKFYGRAETYFGSYGIGDRIGQLVILPIPAVEFVAVDELSDTARGAGGYGSTGV